MVLPKDDRLTLSADASKSHTESIGNGNRSRLTGIGISSMILITFTLQLLVSLSTGIITPLNLAHAELKEGQGDGIPRKISVGGSGGCMWFGNVTGPPLKCIITPHFRPDAEILSLTDRDAIIEAMHTKMGIWRITTYISTTLVGIGLIMFLITLRFRKMCGITAAIFYPITIVSWAALIGQIAYLVIVKKNVDNARPKFNAYPGAVIWMMIASTIMASIMGCMVVWFFEHRRKAKTESRGERGVNLPIVEAGRASERVV
ncbi:uncharacterized protein I303_102978 [Kwoniella dejecticola CBS 10117]|uniref:Uncharacterized protein n=1 Tax=Kwoniella dejecticola CBS 10117 TaxID=1296121 RepID=A0A1A6AA94_9TREE|nr:uncharacterized protein I303_02997 [Kwoniella dejecticola CBS 10117]OBR86975.1 hypothetical protein I303_02997 [Kwoniella dejecticola CBS 10117]